MTTGGMPAATAEEDKGGLRTALAGLTTRGRSFLAAGIAAAVCAYVLGQSDLLRVGLLLAVVVLVLIVIATFRASNGEAYEYPFTIRLVK